jgi:general secretion pathway protein A
VLSNLETADEKLIQIVLVGQPELIERLRMPGMAQLEQRVSVRCGLSFMNFEETKRYIYHRLNVAGAQGRVEFTTPAIRMIYKESRGIPRRINAVCDQALLAGYVGRKRKIGTKEVEQAVGSLRGEEPGVSPVPAATPRRWVRTLGIVVVVAALAGLTLYVLHMTGVITLMWLPRR